MSLGGKSADYTRKHSLPTAPPLPSGRPPQAGFIPAGRCPYNSPVNSPYSVYSPSLANLRSLLAIRAIALLGQTGVLAYVLLVSRTTVSLWGLALSLIGLAAVTALSLWRTTRPWPVTDREFLAQLLIDVLGWTALMYFSGGANNPFVSYYIVPLVIAAAVLPWTYTWLITACSLAAYSALIYFYVPLPLFSPHAAMGHGSEAGQVHTLGMWFNFLFSAGLITYFVVRMATTLRLQEARAAEQREERLRNDQIMAVAGLAAGTAHQLGTPLGTMTVLVDEMLEDPELTAQARQDCQLLREQLTQCKQILSNLGETAEANSVARPRRIQVTQFARDTLERWSVRRPAVPCELRPEGHGAGPDIRCDSTLSQALENLINNAADTGSDRVQLTVDWDAEEARFAVRDWGPGIDLDKLPDPGTPVIQAARSGLGIGLMLSHAAVERHGGRIALQRHPEGGTLATLYLPLAGAEA